MARAHMDTCGTGSVVFIDDVIAERNNRIN